MVVLNEQFRVSKERNEENQEELSGKVEPFSFQLPYYTTTTTGLAPSRIANERKLKSRLDLVFQISWYQNSRLKDIPVIQEATDETYKTVTHRESITSVLKGHQHAIAPYCSPYRMKRAMETIMYGNQQNSNKQVKKSDPSMPLHEDIPDVKAAVLPDDGGSVEASKAEDISESKSDETPVDELDTVLKDVELGDKEDNVVSDSLSEETSSQTEEESNIPPADAEAIEELKNSIGEENQVEDSSEKQPITDVASSAEQNYELSYPNSENYGYGNPYETEDQMEPLEELLEENVLPYPVNSYDEPSWYDYRPTNYEGDEGMYLPVKRQSMLSFVPGNRKRSSPYFYPVSEEPETHFGAFVPEKRNYFDTYGSLVRAARLLAARQEERDPMQVSKIFRVKKSV
ncbi:unnamed protein product [Mytilus edulis]|uniref:Uncharacterized protein n=1 Tax=Mytilus edulis TaxID=6550 RepID=A0A8S3SXG7_MYTED|nr:unnamed protein product [Mytilus edulis]